MEFTFLVFYQKKLKRVLCFFAFTPVIRIKLKIFPLKKGVFGSLISWYNDKVNGKIKLIERVFL